jgi:hypothetical protein
MRIRFGTVLSLLLLALGLATAAQAADPLLSVYRIFNEENNLCLDFHLKGVIDDDLLTSVQNGIPALLSYRVDVWLDRPRWYDKLVLTVQYAYKIHYDNWDTIYRVTEITEGGSDESEADNKAELVHAVCNQSATCVCPMASLNRERNYYITIEAEIQSLSVERVREIDSWLGGSDEVDKSQGGLLGFVVGLFGSNRKTATTRTSPFGLEGLSQ